MTDAQADIAKKLEPYLAKFGYQFINRYRKKHEAALVYVLEAVYRRCLFGRLHQIKFGHKDAWQYANKILRVKEPMFHEQDNINRHQQIMRQVADNAKAIFG